jgi:hypothetical protein
MVETMLEMSRRHVRAGRTLIERQEALLAELERDGHPHALPEGRRTLGDLKKSHSLFESRPTGLEGQV